MADSREIESWRSAYKGYSREELLRVRYEKAEFSAERIAAEQMLDALDRSFLRRMYRVDRHTLYWTVVAAIAAVIAAIVALRSLL
jgi:hypothetical protein